MKWYQISGNTILNVALFQAHIVLQALSIVTMLVCCLDIQVAINAHCMLLLMSFLKLYL